MCVLVRVDSHPAITADTAHVLWNFGIRTTVVTSIVYSKMISTINVILENNTYFAQEV